RDARMSPVNVLDGALKLVFGFVGSVMRELRLVGANQIGGGGGDLLVELEKGRGLRGKGAWKTLGLEVEPHTHQRVTAVPAPRQGLDEGAAHATRALFLRCTSRMETAAGVTPGRRLAWPTVAGRASDSF